MFEAAHFAQDNPPHLLELAMNQAPTYNLVDIASHRASNKLRAQGYGWKSRPPETNNPTKSLLGGF